MRWAERQKQIDQRVCDCMDEVADEFGLKIPFYPKVVWVGRTVKPEYLGFNCIDAEGFYSDKKAKRSCFLPDSNIIVIHDPIMKDIAEESTHALHYAISGIKGFSRSLEDNVFMDVLIEMLGFFGAKMLEPKSRNRYLNHPDMFKSSYNCPEELVRVIQHLKPLDNINPLEFFIYQQGYTLGEVLLYGYTKGVVSRRFIKQLFQDKIDSPGQAFKRFVHLRNHFWKPKQHRR